MKLRTHRAPEFVLGSGAINELGRQVIQHKANRVLVVTDPGVTEAGWLAPVLAELERAKVGVELFAEVTPNPKDLEVMAGAEHYRRSDMRERTKKKVNTVKSKKLNPKRCFHG